MTDLLKQIQENKAKLADQTEDIGGFEYEPPEAGPCIARFVSYIETGDRPQEFKGQKKKPARECILEFQLLGKKHAKEIEVEGEDGTKTKKTIYPIIRIGEGPSGKGGMNMPGGSKSNHYKLLKAMDNGRGNTHMAFMLGEAFLVTVVHADNGKEGKDKVVYANLRDEAGWKVGAPVRIDEEGETHVIKAPEATVPLRLLLWDSPTVEQWDSIYIGGEYTRKVDDKEVTVSKNWIQTTCKKALDFEGSALQTVLNARDGDLPDMSDMPDGLGDEEPPADEQEDLGLGEGTPEDDKGTSDEEIDPLADLGL